jgi:hypothetical protein
MNAYMNAYYYAFIPELKHAGGTNHVMLFGASVTSGRSMVGEKL